jgi:hypothetical protein
MSSIRNRPRILSTVAAAAAAIGLMTATPTSAQQAPASASASGMQAVLAPGGYLRFPDGMKLTFAGVLEDSRCPMDALCTWQGQAVLELELETPTGAARAFEVVYQGKPVTSSIEGTPVTVSDLAPYPLSSAPIEPNDYRVTVGIGAVIITTAEFGGTVHVEEGQTVIVDPDDDVVDYIWTATSSDESVLQPLPQILIFPPPPPAFTALQPGESTLRIVREDPCRHADPPCLLPEQIFEVRVIVH